MRVWIIAFLASLACAATALAHEDVVPYEFNGKLVTGGHDDGTLANNVVQRVFGYDLGEIDPVNLPYFANDPGFNNDSAYPGFPNGNVLPVSKTLGINVLTNLQYWDGLDPDNINFVAAPLGVELGLELGVEARISGTGLIGTTVPNVGGSGPTGRLHVHFNSRLYFEGESLPADPNAPDGIYLVGLQLKMTGVTNSDPFYVVYNNGFLDEEIHDAAINWVQTTLVPEPASWAMMAAGLAALMGTVWRKRRRVPVQG